MNSTLLSVSIALLAGLLMTRVFKPFKLPSVTAYLIAGVIVGPYCLGQLGVGGLGFTDHASMADLALISEVALGFIAFSIGNEFRLDELKQTGKQATVIGIFQALVATLFVDLALFGLMYLLPEGTLSMPQVLTLGAIATATAPAATLMVVRQYKAKGPLTDLLLPIVALDDAVGLIVFAVSFGVAKTLQTGNVDILSIVVNPIIEIVLSLLLGGIMGLILTQLEKFFNSNTNRLNLTIGIVFLTASLSMLEWSIHTPAGELHIAFSSLLTCMMLGTVFCNICDFSAELMDRLDRWTAPIYILFFVLSGAELELSVFASLGVVLVGLAYIASRCLGKYFGARLSADLTGADANVRKYLGITLFPQAGVALGMAMKASVLGEAGAIVSNIVLFSVLVYELVGPYLTKIALVKAGEIDHTKKISNRIKHHDREAHAHISKI